MIPSGILLSHKTERFLALFNETDAEDIKMWKIRREQTNPTFSFLFILSNIITCIITENTMVAIKD